MRVSHTLRLWQVGTSIMALSVGFASHVPHSNRITNTLNHAKYQILKKASLMDYAYCYYTVQKCASSLPACPYDDEPKKRRSSRTIALRFRSPL
ncbi:hypothetical protein BKA61DRAFT_174356 [Leptodontidium sp. MPI-SDFR-AT-0119]|nr:hypothetical protein BKA61DRAFT_174356 [Leptodontidium sp. MPI-SDFR-AT-0119]